jgi:thiamine pyrophosphate-dependent acetolactate synthase large subunit-like protein
VRLAEKLQLPITNSAGHTDVAPIEHPLYAGGDPRARLLLDLLS